MPPPTPYSATPVSASTTTVRMATLKHARGPGAPAGARYPIAPVYTPRGESSRSRMICIVRTLGAPVTDPHGNSARSTSAVLRPGSRRAVTVDVICHTVSYRSVWKRAGTRTDPGRAILPRSLRSRSTIIAFSARSLTEARRLRGGRVVLGHPAAPRGGTLHRPGRDAVAVDAEEELGRRGQHVVPARAQVAVVRGALRPAEVAVERARN